MTTNLTPLQQMGAGLMGGTTLILASLILLLEEKKLIEPGAFAAALEEGAAHSETEKEHGIPEGFPRTDLVMMRQVALLLRKQIGRGWKPVVIQGGLSDE